ncbi:hypothetical protein [Agromyces sp. CCNWLW203]|uniref:hypothetical protein n=1 Tax=Agromyces sp. CCNWLW203 TaxID=3112842 RepID=UPI002F96DFB5
MMKRRMSTTLLVASLATLSCLGTTVAHADEVPAAGQTVVSSSSEAAIDVASLREQVAEHFAAVDLDPATRASIDAAIASDDAFTAATADAVTLLQHGLESAGVDRDDAWAIEPGDYECGPTPMREWTAAELAQIDPASWSWYNQGLLGLSPALFVQYWTLMKTPVAPHETAFGPGGSATNEVSRTFRSLQEFWDIDGSGIGIVSLDAKVLGSDAQAVADREFVYDRFDEVSPLISLILRLSVESGITRGMLDGFPGGVENPVFSVNAFAIDPAGAGDSQDMLETLGITRRIAMGQGLVEVWNDLGLGRVGTRAVLAHEYAHQVQYDDELFETDLTDEAEATRRTELMADAFATYFTVSKRGAALNKEYTLQDLQTFYNVGDCSFANSGHHGTPNQRYASAAWGANLAQSADDLGHVLPSMTVAAGFEQVLPELVAPDLD